MTTTTDASTDRGAKVLTALLARTGPVTVYGQQVDDANPADIITIQEAFGPKAHLDPMTLCLRSQYNGEAWGPVGDWSDDDEQLTLTDTAGQRLVATRRSYPTTIDLSADPAGVVLSPAHADALVEFCGGRLAVTEAEVLAQIEQQRYYDVLTEKARQIHDVLERAVAEQVDVPAAEGTVLHDARVLLGLDGGTGARQIGDDDGPACRVCGCTENQACAGGCWWVPDPTMQGDLCSACQGAGRG